jgi:exodeoxyribonuclease III
VKVATFNINNINKRPDNLLAWLAKAEPDVVSLQELKAEQGAFPVNALRTLGYEAVWQGERSWNGVAILALSRQSDFPKICKSQWRVNRGESAL